MSYTSPSRLLGNIFSNLSTELQTAMGQGNDLPKRHFIQRPVDNGTYILPLKQSFIKDARLMPGTRCMLALLVGWAGHGRGLQLTQARIAKHLGRSVRQVYRYLKDAADNGYLTYNYTKTRIGMITGISVFLRLDRLKPKKKERPGKVVNQARTQESDTNATSFNSYVYDDELEKKLKSFELAMSNSL